MGACLSKGGTFGNDDDPKRGKRKGGKEPSAAASAPSNAAGVQEASAAAAAPAATQPAAPASVAAPAAPTPPLPAAAGPTAAKPPVRPVASVPSAVPAPEPASTGQSVAGAPAAAWKDGPAAPSGAAGAGSLPASLPSTPPQAAGADAAAPAAAAAALDGPSQEAEEHQRHPHHPPSSKPPARLRQRQDLRLRGMGSPHSPAASPAAGTRSPGPATPPGTAGAAGASGRSGGSGSLGGGPTPSPTSREHVDSAIASTVADFFTDDLFGPGGGSFDSRALNALIGAEVAGSMAADEEEEEQEMERKREQEVLRAGQAVVGKEAVEAVGVAAGSSALGAGAAAPESAQAVKSAELTGAGDALGAQPAEDRGSVEVGGEKPVGQEAAAGIVSAAAPAVKSQETAGPVGMDNVAADSRPADGEDSGEHDVMEGGDSVASAAGALLSATSAGVGGSMREGASKRREGLVSGVARSASDRFTAAGLALDAGDSDVSAAAPGLEEVAKQTELSREDVGEQERSSVNNLQEEADGGGDKGEELSEGRQAGEMQGEGLSLQSPKGKDLVDGEQGLVKQEEVGGPGPQQVGQDEPESEAKQETELQLQEVDQKQPEVSQLDDDGDQQQQKVEQPAELLEQQKQLEGEEDAVAKSTDVEGAKQEAEEVAIEAPQVAGEAVGVPPLRPPAGAQSKPIGKGFERERAVRMGASEIAAATAMAAVLASERGQELESLRRSAAALVAAENDAEEHVEDALLKVSILTREERIVVARVAPGLAAQMSDLGARARHHAGRTLRGLAEREQTVGFTAVSEAMELARGCARFMDSVMDRDSVPAPTVADPAVVCAVAGLAEAAAAHALNLCLWEKMGKAVPGDGGDLGASADRVLDLSSSVMRVFEAMVPGGAGPELLPSGSMAGGQSRGLTVTYVVKLAELATGHTRALHANMLKQQFMRAAQHQQQIDADVLEFGPRTINFFSSHFRLAKDAADMSASVAAGGGGGGVLTGAEDKALIQDLHKRAQAHADRICETAGDVDSAILLEGADMATVITTWTSRLLGEQVGGKPSVATTVMAGAASLDRHTAVLFAALADKAVKGNPLTRALVSEAASISAMARAYAKLLVVVVRGSSGGGGGNAAPAAAAAAGGGEGGPTAPMPGGAGGPLSWKSFPGLLLDPSAVSAYCQFSTAAAAFSLKIATAAAAAGEGGEDGRNGEGGGAKVSVGLVCEAAALVMMACTNTKLSLSTSSGAGGGGGPGRGGMPGTMAGGAGLGAAGVPGFPSPEVVEDAKGLLDKARLYVSMLEKKLHGVTTPSKGGPGSQSDAGGKRNGATDGSKGPGEAEVLWDAKLATEGLRLSVLASAHVRLLQDKFRAVSATGGSAAAAASSAAAARAAQLAKKAAVHARMVAVRWMEDAHLDPKEVEEAEGLASLADSHAALLLSPVGEPTDVPFSVAQKATALAEEAANLLSTLAAKQLGGQTVTFSLAAPVVRVVVAIAAHTQELQLANATVRSLLGWDVAALLEDAGRLAMGIATRAAEGEDAHDLVAEGAGLVYKAVAHARGVQGMVREGTAPETDPSIVFAAQELADLAGTGGVATALARAHDRGLLVDGELTARVRELLTRLASHAAALRAAEGQVGPAAAAGVALFLAELAALQQNLEVRREDRRKVERADRVAALRLAGKLATHAQYLQAQAAAVDLPLAAAAAGLAGQVAKQVQVLASKAASGDGADDEVEQGVTHVATLATTHKAALLQAEQGGGSGVGGGRGVGSGPLAPTGLGVGGGPGAGGGAGGGGAGGSAVVRVGKLVDVANTLSQELWDRGTSGGGLDVDTLAVGANLLTLAAEHAALLQMQANECGCADPVSVSEARELADLVTSHLKSLSERQSEGIGMDAAAVADAAKLVLLGVGHARRLQFQEASVGAALVTEAVGLARQLGSHLQAVATKADVHACADSSLVGLVETYASVADSHVASLLQRSRMLSTADATVAISAVAFAARASLYSAQLQFFAAAGVKAGREVSTEAGKLLVQVGALRVAVGTRVDAGGALDEDSMTRVEEVEAQVRVHEERMRDLVGRGGGGAGGGVGGGGAGGPMVALTMKVVVEAARMSAKAALLGAKAVARAAPLAAFPPPLVAALQAAGEQSLSQAELLRSMARNNSHLDVSTAAVALDTAARAFHVGERLHEHLQGRGGAGSGGSNSSGAGSSSSVTAWGLLKPEVVDEGLQLAASAAKLAGDAAIAAVDGPQLELQHVAELSRLARQAATHARVVDGQKVAVSRGGGLGVGGPGASAGVSSVSTPHGGHGPGAQSGRHSLPRTPRTPSGGPPRGGDLGWGSEAGLGGGGGGELGGPGGRSRRESGGAAGGEGLLAAAAAMVSNTQGIVAVLHAGAAGSAAHLALRSAQGLSSQVDLLRRGGGKAGIGLVGLLCSLSTDAAEHAAMLVRRAPPAGAVPVEAIASGMALVASAGQHVNTLTACAASGGRVAGSNIALAVALAAKAAGHAQLLRGTPGSSSSIGSSSSSSPEPLDLMVSPAVSAAAAELADGISGHASNLASRASAAAGMVAVDVALVASAAAQVARAAAHVAVLQVQGWSPSGGAGGGGGGGGAGGAGGVGGLGAPLDPSVVAAARGLLEDAELHMESVRHARDSKAAVDDETVAEAASFAAVAMVRARDAFKHVGQIGLPAALAAAGMARDACTHADLVVRRALRGAGEPMPLAVVKSAEDLVASVRAHAAVLRDRGEATEGNARAGANGRAEEEGGDLISGAGLGLSKVRREVCAAAVLGGATQLSHLVAHAMLVEARAAAAEQLDADLVSDIAGLPELVACHLHTLSRAAAALSGVASSSPALFQIMTGGGTQLAKKVATHLDVMRGRVAAGGRVDARLAAVTLRLAADAAQHARRLREEMLHLLLPPGQAQKLLGSSSMDKDMASRAAALVAASTVAAAQQQRPSSSGGRAGGLRKGVGEEAGGGGGGQGGVFDFEALVAHARAVEARAGEVIAVDGHTLVEGMFVMTALLEQCSELVQQCGLPGGGSGGGSDK